MYIFGDLYIIYTLTDSGYSHSGEISCLFSTNTTQPTQLTLSSFGYLSTCSTDISRNFDTKSRCFASIFSWSEKLLQVITQININAKSIRSICTELNGYCMCVHIQISEILNHQRHEMYDVKSKKVRVQM